MKKQILSFSLATVMMLGLSFALLSSEKSEAAVAPIITCPSGDDYICYYIFEGVVYGDKRPSQF